MKTRVTRTKRYESKTMKKKRKRTNDSFAINKRSNNEKYTNSN